MLDGDYNTTFRCKVDQINKINFIYQNTFSLDYQNYIGSILECIDLFYSNEFPIFIVESNNGGGYADIFIILHQLMQMRIANRVYMSYGLKNKSKEFLEHYGVYETDQETCELITSVDKLIEIEDHYDYDNLNITHKRSKGLDLLSASFRQALNGYKERFKDSPYLKKPTDIIIFTDAYS